MQFVDDVIKLAYMCYMLKDLLLVLCLVMQFSLTPRQLFQVGKGGFILSSNFEELKPRYQCCWSVVNSPPLNSNTVEISGMRITN